MSSLVIIKLFIFFRMFFSVNNTKQTPELKKQLTRWDYTNVWIIHFFILIYYSIYIHNIPYNPLKRYFFFKNILRFIGTSQVLKLVKILSKICGERRTWSIRWKPVLLKSNIGVFHSLKKYNIMKFRVVTIFGVAIGVSLQGLLLQILKIWILTH